MPETGPMENMSLTELNRMVRNHEFALESHRGSIDKSLEGLHITTGILRDHMKSLETLTAFVKELSARLTKLEAGK